LTGFTVDTHLLRELGELLVGRDSTAVIELVKNAYDADATIVTLDADALGTSGATLRVVDDGNGMTYERFTSAFLRIAGRDKEIGQRRSPRFGRRYTGQKGIGRLAAHKLATWMGVISIPRREPAMRTLGVRAELDWNLIEQQDDLGSISEGLGVEAIAPLPSQSPGTVLELRRLRSNWSERQLVLFVTELRAAQPPQALLDPKWPGAVPRDKSLLGEPQINDTGEDDPGFRISLTGDLDVGEDLWQRAANEFEWLVEIDASQEVVRYQITPLRNYALAEPSARTYRFQRTAPLEGRPRFQARIFTMRRASRSGPLGGFVRASSGVRVYLEGFRVLPYGEYGDDWLELDRDYRTGPRFYKIDFDAEMSDQLETDRREALVATGNTGYFGAVFLTDRGASGLRSLVNREGFVPDATFEMFVQLVQTGIRLSVRVRRAVYLRKREREISEQELADLEKAAAASRAGSGARRTSEEPARTAGEDEPQQQQTSRSDSDSQQSPGGALGVDVFAARSARAIEQARSAVARLQVQPALAEDNEAVDSVIQGFQAANAELARLRTLQPDLRVLASVGLQLGAFVHDINGMLGQASTVRELLESLIEDETLTRAQRTRLRRVARTTTDLAHTLARQSAYLTDVLVADPRRRRSRVRLTERLDTVRRLLAGQLARLQVDIQDRLPPELKTPPMFPAEVGVVLTNLLTNAVKNAGSPGRVIVTGELLGSRGVVLLVHNTGNALDLDDAERWFLPFESTTTEVNEVLGQGLGLGLPITRALVEDYRGTIGFVPPPSGFATSVRVELPDAQEAK